MVELSRGAAIAAGAGVGGVLLLLLGLLVRSSRRWRAGGRRLAATATRLERPGQPVADDRLDAQAVPPHQVVPVHLLLAQAVDGACGSEPGRGVTIEVDAGGAPRDLVVVGDRRQLVSALRHLVGTAVRFSGDGGRVFVASTEGAGSTFTLRLPAGRTGSAPSVPAAAPAEVP